MGVVFAQMKEFSVVVPRALSGKEGRKAFLPPSRGTLSLTDTPQSKTRSIGVHLTINSHIKQVKK